MNEATLLATPWTRSVTYSSQTANETKLSKQVRKTYASRPALRHLIFNRTAKFFFSC